MARNNPNSDSARWQTCITSLLNGPASLPDLRGLPALVGTAAATTTDQVQASTPSILRAKTFYNRVSSWGPPRKMYFVIPMGSSSSSKGGQTAASPAQDLNIQVFVATAERIYSERVPVVTAAATRSNNGLILTCITRVVNAMCPLDMVGPEIILLWALWDVRLPGNRLPGLEPAVYLPNGTCGEHLSFCLSRWIGEARAAADHHSSSPRRRLWAFLPLDCMTADYGVVFDEKPSGANQIPEFEERIWAYSGVHVIFYSTAGKSESYRAQMEAAQACSSSSTSSSTYRPDQILLNTWMDEAMTQTDRIRQLGPLKPDNAKGPLPELKVRVENSVGIHEYSIPGAQVYGVMLKI
jgi:hypothetical protein